METWNPERCELIELRIKEATSRWGCKVWVQSHNYGSGVAICVERPDGARRAWKAGVINYPPEPDETDGWEPITAEVEPAIAAAIDFAKPV